MRKQVAIILVALLASVLPARAIVLLNGSLQFTDPGSGLPWANVGSVGGASGVYLGNFGGNYWVLTASHVVGSGGSLSNLVLDSGTFNFVPGSGIVVRNGDTSTTDLTLFRISTDPGLTNLTLATSAPAASSLVTMIGLGSIEGAANYWSVTVNGGANDDVWIDQGSTSAGSNRAGYLWAGNTNKRWGQNLITNNASTYNVGTGDTAAFYTTFADIAGFHEAQGAVGDSGGATFYFNGSSWELVGILGAIATLENQPGSTAVIGNATFSSSIGDYNGFIVSAIPEPSATTALAGLLAFGVIYLARRRK